MVDDRAQADEQGEDLGGATNAAVEQFRRAALDAVQAARAVLDAAESMIKDPAAVDALVDTVSAVARSATESVAEFAAAATKRPAPGTGTTPDDDDPAPDDGYHEISVE